MNPTEFLTDQLAATRREAEARLTNPKLKKSAEKTLGIVAAHQKLVNMLSTQRTPDEYRLILEIISDIARGYGYGQEVA